MKNIIFQFFLVLISFTISYELISELNSNKSRLNIDDKGFSYQSDLLDRDVYFVGDSYASTNYVDNPYPRIFRDYFKSKGLNFFDYSKAGSELNTHKLILDSISKKKPELIIYFYNISDIVSLNSDILFLDNREIEMDKTSDKSISNKKTILKDFLVNAYKSHTLTLMKSSIQYISLKSTSRFYKGSPANRFYKENKMNSNQLEKIFDGIKAENVIILINTPFNSHPLPKKWEHYEVFKEMSYNKDYKLLQAVDIIEDPNFSVSWRNGHPNQKGIQIIADQIIEIVDTNLIGN
ncbi:hypothetical protein OAC33_00210 [Flavobacteriaceae bacterium]|nr:hypothetical protein [Flavobacteriaceae bacterium]